MRKNFVDKEINSYDNDKALEKLKIKNDKDFLMDNDGIIKVSKERWQEAQYYEKKTWDIHQNIKDMPNRNMEHVIDFDNYSILNKNISNKHIDIIELGCGPFTQVTHILRRIEYKTVNLDLLDPLIKHYSTLNNCVYKNEKLLDFENINLKLINSSIEEYNR